MIQEAIKKALEKAKIERMDDEEIYYGEIDDLKGIWATGNTHEECKANLQKAIEDWMRFSSEQELPITALEDFEIKKFEEAGILK